MKYFGLVVFCLIALISYSQNLVPNGDFEDYSQLPNDEGQWSFCDSWVNVIDENQNFSTSTPDYFHQLGVGIPNLPFSGVATLNPQSGSACVGLLGLGPTGFFEYREYLTVEMNEQMIIGNIYKLSIWVTNGSHNHFFGASSTIGMLMSTSKLVQINNQPIEISPTFEFKNSNWPSFWSTQWENFIFYFEADSNYKHLTLGNFYVDSLSFITTEINNTSNLSYYFFDNVEITLHKDLNKIVGDSIICKGDTSELEVLFATNINWVNAENPTETLSTDSIFTVSPDTTTTYLMFDVDDTTSFTVHVIESEAQLPNDTTLCLKESLSVSVDYPFSEILWQDGSSVTFQNISVPGLYWLEVENACGTLRDSLQVDYEDCSCKIIAPDAFTPNNDQLNDKFGVHLDCKFSDFHINIYTRWGGKIFESNDITKYWDGKLNNIELPSDVYFYSVSFVNEKGNPQHSSSQVSLIR